MALKIKVCVGKIQYSEFPVKKAYSKQNDGRLKFEISEF